MLYRQNSLLARKRLLVGSVLAVAAANNIQGLFATVSGLADEALFLTDLMEFLQQHPAITLPPSPKPFPSPVNASLTKFLHGAPPGPEAPRRLRRPHQILAPSHDVLTPVPFGIMMHILGQP